eukprot:7230904-Prorocentrum_lima.AAC.1
MDSVSSFSTPAKHRRTAGMARRVATSLDNMQHSMEQRAQDRRIETVVNRLRETPALLGRIEAVIDAGYEEADVFPRGVRPTKYYVQ